MRIKTIYTEITNQCNLNCTTCYNRSGLNKVHIEIRKEQFECIIEYFLPFGLNRFLISGGEPTLHTEFDNILDLVDEYPKLLFGIVTNGTNYNEKLIEFLNTRNNLTLQLSLDGSNDEINSLIRGTGYYNKLIQFARKINNPNMKPLLKMVISQYNFDDIENFYNLAISINYIPEFAFIYKSGNGVNNWGSKALSAQQKLKALNLIDNLNIKNNIEAFLPLCTSRCPYTNTLDNLSLCIKVDGSIQPCQSLYEDRFSLGNAFNLDINLFETKLNETMKLAQNRLATDFNCNKCIIKSNCGKGCMASATNLFSDPLANDGDCDFRKLQFIGYDLKGVVTKK